jgi:hypothetical protein
MGFFDDDAPGVSSSMTLMSNPAAAVAPLFLLADGLRDDIKPSYFATLGLFVLSAPGLWSLVKRSAKSKIDRKTFEVAGPSAEHAMPLDELAREISMHFRRNNYEIAEAGEGDHVRRKHRAREGNRRVHHLLRRHRSALHRPGVLHRAARR